MNLIKLVFNVKTKFISKFPQEQDCKIQWGDAPCYVEVWGCEVDWIYWKILRKISFCKTGYLSKVKVYSSKI